MLDMGVSKPERKKQNRRRAAAVLVVLGSAGRWGGLKADVSSPDVRVIEITLTFVLYCIVQLQQGPSLAYVSNWECFPGVYGRHGVYLDLHGPVAPTEPRS